MNDQEQQQFMQMQQQLQTIMVQKENLKTEKDEIETALDEIEEHEGDDLYRSVGMLLIKRDPDELQDNLAKEKEDLEMKIKSLERKEDQLKEKVQDAQEQLTAGMGTGGDGPLAG